MDWRRCFVTQGDKMKAIICTKYGPPGVLQHREVEIPVPKDNEALVKVYASSLNAADLEILKGVFVNRIAAPLRPMHKILGTDMAGQIGEVGTKVKRFQPGDEIWGDLSFPLGSGAFAEYVCVPENALRLKPPSMTFEEAAAIPTAGVVALQNLLAKRPIQPGQKVLVNGAGGGVGTFAVQIAKHFGAEVTGVDSRQKLEMLRLIGADHVIDYNQEDFTKNGQHYDLILDIVVQRWIFDYRRALTREGIVVMVGGSMTRVFLNILIGKMMTGKKKIGLGAWKPNQKEDLHFLKELFEAGKVKPVIDGCYQLSDVPEAFRHLQEGLAKGKIVITVADSNKT
jgi:NADPH:quinone reductase-like Zn-dependent oxidoreductase